MLEVEELRLQDGIRNITNLGLNEPIPILLFKN